MSTVPAYCCPHGRLRTFYNNCPDCEASVSTQPADTQPTGEDEGVHTYTSSGPEPRCPHGYLRHLGQTCLYCDIRALPKPPGPFDAFLDEMRRAVERGEIPKYSEPKQPEESPEDRLWRIHRSMR